MVIDPRKMKAFAQGTPAPAPGKPGAPKKPTEMPPEGDAEETEDSGDAEGEELDEGGPARFAPVMELLEQAASDIEESLTDLDPAALLDTDSPLAPDQIPLMQDCIDALDDDLVEGLRSEASELTAEEAMSLGQHLASEGYATDGDLLGGWLWHAAQVLREPSEMGADAGMMD